MAGIQLPEIPSTTSILEKEFHWVLAMCEPGFSLKNIGRSLFAEGSVGIEKTCVLPLIATSDDANTTKTRLIRIFFLLFVVREKIIAQMVAISPTKRAVPSPPSNDKNKTTRIAPVEAPIKSNA